MNAEVLLLFVAPDGRTRWFFADTEQANVLTHGDYVHLCRLAAQTGMPLLAETPSTFLDLVQTIGSATITLGGSSMAVCEIAIQIAQERKASAEAMLMIQILVYGGLGVVVNETMFDTLALCMQRAYDREAHAEESLAFMRSVRTGILTLDPCVWQLRRGAHFYRPGFVASSAPACMWKTELVSGVRHDNEQAVTDDFERRPIAARYLFYESILTAFGPPFAPGPLPPQGAQPFFPRDLVPPPELPAPYIPPLQLEEQLAHDEYSAAFDMLHDIDMAIVDTSRSPVHESYNRAILGSVSPQAAANAMLMDELFS